MLGTAVPETTINEYYDARRTKNKVRLSEYQLPASPTSDSAQAQELHQGDFRILIAMSANSGHDLRAFCFGENVGHESSGRKMVGHQPRRCAHHFISLLADASFSGLVAVKLVVR